MLSYVYLAKVEPRNWNLRPHRISLGTYQWTIRQPKFCYILSFEKCCHQFVLQRNCKAFYGEVSRKSSKPPVIKGLIFLLGFNWASSSALSELDLSSCQYLFYTYHSLVRTNFDSATTCLGASFSPSKGPCFVY